MKYKVGDVVKLKSKEKLIRECGLSEEIAHKIGGKKVSIDTVLDGLYRTKTEEILLDFSDNVIEYQFDNTHGTEMTYTFEELKSEVEKFREYLLNAGNKNGCCIDVSFSSTKYEGLNTVANVKSDISINFNGITIETD